MAHFFVKHGAQIMIESDEATQTLKELPAANYVVKFNPMGGFYLETAEEFVLPEKLYGHHPKDADRVLSTFMQRTGTTGVLLSGEKGSGKTMLTKLISSRGQAKGMPTLIVNQPYVGDAFNSFLSAIVQPCIVLFDEFEKVYPPEQQQQILTLMDGVFTTQKLFLLTCNDLLKINAHMKNRPGRLFYHIDYEGLDERFIEEYCQDKLLNKAHIPSVVAVTSLFWRFNFDMLQAIVEEMNRYGEGLAEALRLLNCKPDFGSNADYRVELKVGGKAIEHKHMEGSGTFQGTPLGKPFHIAYYTQDSDGEFNEWTMAKFDSNDIVQMDARAGFYHFRNTEAELTLRKVEKKVFDYMTAIDRTNSFASVM